MSMASSVAVFCPSEEDGGVSGVGVLIMGIGGSADSGLLGRGAGVFTGAGGGLLRGGGLTWSLILSGMTIICFAWVWNRSGDISLMRPIWLRP